MSEHDEPIFIDIVVRRGHTHIIVEGHASMEVCAAISAIMQTAAMGLAGIAAVHVQEARLTQFVWPKENAVVVSPQEAASLRPEGTG